MPPRRSTSLLPSRRRPAGPRRLGIGLDGAVPPSAPGVLTGSRDVAAGGQDAALGAGVLTRLKGQTLWRAVCSEPTGEGTTNRAGRSK